MIDDREIEAGGRTVGRGQFLGLPMDAAAVEHREKVGEFERGENAEWQIEMRIGSQGHPVEPYVPARKVSACDRMGQQTLMALNQVCPVEV
ncbi:hypothetical protein, partial [Escherichia coli]|uniref:hypothetical protein n=1 Tax=Escherichia coli TaxID=562 RepID=UPI00112FA219